MNVRSCTQFGGRFGKFLPEQEGVNSFRVVLSSCVEWTVRTLLFFKLGVALDIWKTKSGWICIKTFHIVFVLQTVGTVTHVRSAYGGHSITSNMVYYIGSVPLRMFVRCALVCYLLYVHPHPHPHSSAGVVLSPGWLAKGSKNSTCLFGVDGSEHFQKSESGWT